MTNCAMLRKSSAWSAPALRGTATSSSSQPAWDCTFDRPSAGRISSWEKNERGLARRPNKATGASFDEAMQCSLDTNCPHVKFVARRRAPMASPSDHYADRRRKTPELRRTAHLAVHRPSANLIAGDGTKNGLSRSEQRTGSKTQKRPLDRKSPIQVVCEPEDDINIP